VAAGEARRYRTGVCTAYPDLACVLTLAEYVQGAGGELTWVIAAWRASLEGPQCPLVPLGLDLEVNAVPARIDAQPLRKRPSQDIVRPADTLGWNVPEGDIPGRSEHPELRGRTRIKA
jgi:hypothetical protein